MKKICFDRTGTIIKSTHRLELMPMLPERETKLILSADARPNALAIVGDWNQFEQYTEYEDEIKVRIHFVDLKNRASYFSFDNHWGIDDSRVQAFTKKPEIMLEYFKVEYDFFRENLFKAGIKPLNLIEPGTIELKNLRKSWPINDYPSNTTVCYIDETDSFCISIVSAIQALYPQLDVADRPKYLENLKYYVNYKTGLVSFSFDSDVNLQHHRYRTTDFSGSFSLLDFTGTITNNGSYSYSSN